MTTATEINNSEGLFGERILLRRRFMIIAKISIATWMQNDRRAVIIFFSCTTLETT
jgi:hypothetical protein